jgi:hypothetical protein
MAKLSVPTVDAGSLFEAFDPNRNNLTGEIATIALELTPDSSEPGSLEKLGSSIADSAFVDQILEAADTRVRKKLGAGYSIYGSEFNGETREIRLTVGTPFDETSSPQSTAKGIAEVAEEIGANIAEILSEQFEVPVRARVTLKPEAGLNSPLQFIGEDTPSSALEEHRTYLRWQRKRVSSLRTWLLVVSSVSIAALILVIAIQSEGSGQVVVLLYVALIAAIALVLNRMLGARIGEFDDDIREAGNELDLRRIETDQGEARAQKLFQSHAFEIKRYYDQALRQGRSIYYVGIVCIAMGFAVIGAAFALVSSADSKDLSGQIIVGVLGATGAILANFIAVVYLKMFSDTVGALTSFHQRLVITHHLHFGNFLTSKIKDKKTRERALAEMSMGLSTASRIDLSGLQASPNGGPADDAV